MRDEHIAGWPAIAHSSSLIGGELESTRIDGVDAEDCSMRSGLALRSLGISFQLDLCCNLRNPCMKEYSTS